MDLNRAMDLIEHLDFSVYMVRCEIKNGHQKVTCSKGIGLRALNMLTIMCSIANIKLGVGGGAI